LPFRVDDLVGAIRSVIDGTAVRTAVGSAGRYGGPMTVPSIRVGDEDPAGSASPPVGDHPGGEQAAEVPSSDRSMAASTNGGSR
jgi:hypothetical protein